MPQFSKTNQQNLVRHSVSGKYYLSCKHLGKKIRKSLETNSLRIACMRRDDELARIRSNVTTTGSKTIGDALELTLRRKQSDPSIKSSTRAFYGHACATLRRIMPCQLRTWSADQQRDWWKRTITCRSSAWINNTHALVKAIIETARAEGLAVDPCPLRRVPSRRQRESTLPSMADFPRIVENIRTQRKAHSEEMADMVEFLAWSGCRIGELQALEWEDVDKEWLIIRGGAEGTKNRKIRRLPISAPLRAIIDRRYFPDASGKIFHLASPRESLKNACARLGIDHIRVHDLRHLFATRCIEKGIDIPTVAKWLGHSDGGALAMKTYGHLRDDHSLSAAKLLG